MGSAEPMADVLQSRRAYDQSYVKLHEKYPTKGRGYSFRKTCDDCEHHVDGMPCGEGDCRKHRPPWGRDMCAWHKERRGYGRR